MSCAPKGTPRLARRLIIGLAALQAVLVIVLILTEPLRESSRPGDLLPWLAAEQAGQILAPAIGRNAAGNLALQVTPELRDYMQARPAFWFVVTDGDRLLRGGAVQDRNKDVVDDDGVVVPSRMSGQGAPMLLATPAGRVGAMLGNAQSGLLEGLAVWLADRLWHGLVGLLLLALGNAVVILLLVRFLLRPVRAAAAAAQALQPEQRGMALPEEGVPAEILPLVSATNAALARLEHAHAQQRRFIANAAHELRTPIAILTLRLDALPDDALRQRLQQDLQRLTLLAVQLLDLERLQHAGPPRGRVELVALAREVMAEMAPLAVDGGHELAFSSALPRLEVAGDEQALRSVFSNLIGNALTHGGPANQVALRILADRSLEVADRGPGIPPEARDKIFEPFQRGARNGPGAGLGLAIVRQVLQAHGAGIRLVEAGIPDGGPDGGLGGLPGACFRITF
ncbi:cell wall metabolism sensor histidine kinase WalK [Roseomonas sp. 18066]|uniref:sensor histidine kinase n=1 Tax=Roseomonas sp. 18066 TaxID=2681412 RepID=UPI00135B5E32|nr:HAMP domain-containing sensor histidine kinase [Roseomonas sp. 18066]